MKDVDRPDRPGKNIVICCDGTDNELGSRDSNVLKLYGLLKKDRNQVTYYHPGLGTEGEINRPGFWGATKRFFKRMAGLIIGYGIFGNIGRSYKFLMDNFEPGDKIFVFGFSRGAYTAKALASMIKLFGILDRGNDILISYALKRLKKSPPDLKTCSRYKSAFGRPSEIHFLGLWDTVSSVGLLWNTVSLPYTAENDLIHHGRHAISIDERRAFFRPNLWRKSDSKQDLKEVWFAGDHSDVGGGHEGAPPSLSNISLSWMLREAETHGLFIDSAEKDELLSEVNYEIAATVPLHDLSQSLGWKILEYLPKRYWSFRQQKYRLKWPMRTPRYLPSGAILHESVVVRKDLAVANYKPENLPEEYETES